MCDTVIATAEATADGAIILAKNSDREPNEAQVLTYVPHTQHEPGTVVKCTYVEIPQVEETNEVLLSRPFWIWGCEMGVNEHGVAIGNEAVFTKEPYNKGPALTGMDLARLALERTDTARGALELIVDLLQTYGQGGDGGFKKSLYYHNSFIIADPNAAWVLETAGKFWAAERVRGVRTISNGISIEGEWDLASPGLVEHAVEKGWCRSEEEFSFARCYSDFLYTRFGGCRARQRRSTELLEAEKGHITVKSMMEILRDHGPRAEDDPRWHPGKGLFMDSLCVHASLLPTRPSQCTGSLIAHLAPDMPTFWVTGASTPCTGIFKPAYLGGAGLPDLGPEPTGTYDPQSLWWTHERLHRAVIRNYPTRMAMIREERDAQEAQFLSEAAEMYERYRGTDADERAAPLAEFTESCFQRAATATESWTAAVSAAPRRLLLSPLFSLSWALFNRQAGFNPRRRKRRERA